MSLLMMMISGWILSMVFQPIYINPNERITTEYANQNLRDNMNVLNDLLYARAAEITADLDDDAIPGETDDWQVISTISAGELDTDLYFRWSCNVENDGIINGEIGWRKFGSSDVNVVKSPIMANDTVSIKRILHSEQDNEGIIEIVARNSATTTSTPTVRFDTPWSVRYRWEWTETSTKTVRERYQVTVRVPYTVTVNQQYTVRVPVTTRTCSQYVWCYRQQARTYQGVDFPTQNLCDRDRNVTVEAHSFFAARGFSVSGISRHCSHYTTKTTYRDEVRTRQVEETRWRNDVQTRYRDRPVRTTVNKRTDWTVVRSGTATQSTAEASRTAAAAAADAVQVSTTGRPNSNARATIQRTVGDTVDRSATTVVPAGTMNINQIMLKSQILLGKASPQP